MKIYLKIILLVTKNIYIPSIVSLQNLIIEELNIEFHLNLSLVKFELNLYKFVLLFFFENNINAKYHHTRLHNL
jgi:hypothetical protein